MSMEMYFLRWSARCSRLEEIRNNVIRKKMNIKNSFLDYRRYKQLNWYGQVQRMYEERLPRKFLEWKTMKGKTSKFVDAEVTTGMRERGELTTWNEATEKVGEEKLS